MKTIKYVCYMLFVTCYLVFTLSACFSPLGGHDEIGVTVSLGSGQGRFTASDYDRRVIEVTTPGGVQTIELSPGQHAITISGRPGTWHIEVKYYDPILNLPAAGVIMRNINVQMGPPITIEPTMEEFDDIPISNEADLRRIAEVQDRPNVLNRNYYLTRNITLSSAPWTPIGRDSPATARFIGTFDGNGHTISGLTINRDQSHQGMFGVIGNDGEVKNLGLINVNLNVFEGDDVIASLGGVVGVNRGTVQYCYVTGNVSGRQAVGGVVGNNWNIVEKCYSTATVRGFNSAGGVVGNNLGIVRHSYSTGIIEGNSTSRAAIGGVVGDNSGIGTRSGTVQYCYSTAIVNGNQQIGGVVGDQLYISTTPNGTVQNSVALNASIIRFTLTTASFGRVAGENAGTINNNYARSDMLFYPSPTAAGTTSFPTDDAIINGQNISVAQYHNASWWTTAANWDGGAWDETIWDIAQGRLPRLRGVGGNQNPRVN